VVREYIVDPFETICVREIMARPGDTLAADMPIADVVAFFTAPRAAPGHKSYPGVDNDGGLVGMVARADALRWTMTGWPAGETVGERVADQKLLTGLRR
jgi:chloride channel protein, CIC family